MPQAINEVTDAQTGITTQVMIPWTKDAAKQHVAALRYDREVAGITVNGVLCATERGDHRQVMLSLYVFAQVQPQFSVSIKMPGGGWVPATAAEAAQMYLCGQQYVAQCFAVERAAVDAIDAATTSEAIDDVLNAIVWPSQVFVV